MPDEATIRVRLVVDDEQAATAAPRRQRRRTGSAEREAAAQEAKGETITSRVKARLRRKFGLDGKPDTRSAQELRRDRRGSFVAGAVVGRLQGAAAASGAGAVTRAAGAVQGSTGLGVAGAVGIGALAVGAAAFVVEVVAPLVLEAVTTALEPILFGQKEFVDGKVREAADAVAQLTARVQTAFAAVGQTLERERARALIGGEVQPLTTFGKVSDILTAQKALQKKSRRELDREVVRNLTKQALDAFDG